ncbi:MAG: hypothetical protein VX112_00865 [Pseudomonadota bacterium]|nr:hypothetical protein [Pseudomonadota bacterium]
MITIIKKTTMHHTASQAKEPAHFSARAQVYINSCYMRLVEVVQYTGGNLLDLIGKDRDTEQSVQSFLGDNELDASDMDGDCLISSKTREECILPDNNPSSSYQTIFSSFCKDHVFDQRGDSKQSSASLSK